MMRKPTLSIPSLYQNLHSYLIQFTIISSFFFNITITAQNKEQLIGHWQLQKVSYKKKIVQTSETNKEQLFEIFKTALYNQLSEEQKLNLDNLDQINSEAEILVDTYYQTIIEFQVNGAFYNTSQNQTKSLSGEYLLDKKKLLIEWETADKNNFKIIIISADELILKDIKLKITYYYNKLQQKQVDEITARLKKEKELECIIPDKTRIEAQKVAEEKLKSNN
jgi:hypothetical protein